MYHPQAAAENWKKAPVLKVMAFFPFNILSTRSGPRDLEMYSFTAGARQLLVNSSAYHSWTIFVLFSLWSSSCHVKLIDVVVPNPDHEMKSNFLYCECNVFSAHFGICRFVFTMIIWHMKCAMFGECISCRCVFWCYLSMREWVALCFKPCLGAYFLLWFWNVSSVECFGAAHGLSVC